MVFIKQRACRCGYNCAALHIVCPRYKLADVALRKDIGSSSALEVPDGANYEVARNKSIGVKKRKLRRPSEVELRGTRRRESLH